MPVSPQVPARGGGLQGRRSCTGAARRRLRRAPHGLPASARGHRGADPMINVDDPVLGAAAVIEHSGDRVVARTPTQLAFDRLRHDRGAIAAVVVIAFMVVLAVAAPLIARWTGHPVNAQYRDTGLTEFGLPVGPRAEFWLGTDQLGRDILVRLAYGARVSIAVAAVSS